MNIVVHYFLIIENIYSKNESLSCIFWNLDFDSVQYFSFPISALGISQKVLISLAVVDLPALYPRGHRGNICGPIGGPGKHFRSIGRCHGHPCGRRGNISVHLRSHRGPGETFPVARALFLAWVHRGNISFQVGPGETILLWT